MSYSEDLRYIKQQRRRVLAISFSICVLLPTFFTSIYYGLIASPLYTSHNKFTVTIDDSNSISSSIEGGIGALLTGSAAGSNIQEAHVVKEYITSIDMIKHLKKNINLYDIYNSENADFFSKPKRNPSIESFSKYYNKNINIQMNEKNGMISLDVDAFSPQESKTISEAIFIAAEKFVNERSDRIQKDSLRFSEEFLQEAEKQVLDDNIKLSYFRNQNKNFDPTITATGVLAITADLEGELAKTETEIATLSNFLKSDNTRIKALNAKAQSLKDQISSQSSRLASKDGSTLANLSQEYEALKLKSEFSLKRYSMALASYEQARSSANKQKKYLVRVVGPTLPEDSIKPNAAYKIITTFLIMAVLYLLGSLMISALIDHIRG